MPIFSHYWLIVQILKLQCSKNALYSFFLMGTTKYTSWWNKYIRFLSETAFFMPMSMKIQNIEMGMWICDSGDTRAKIKSWITLFCVSLQESSSPTPCLDLGIVTMREQLSVVWSHAGYHTFLWWPGKQMHSLKEQKSTFS
jgi:hypothetical protein